MLKVFKFYGDKDFDNLFNILLEEKLSKVKTDINMDESNEDCLSTSKGEEVDKDE